MKELRKKSAKNLVCLVNDILHLPVGQVEHLSQLCEPLSVYVPGFQNIPVAVAMDMLIDQFSDLAVRVCHLRFLTPFELPFFFVRVRVRFLCTTILAIYYAPNAANIIGNAVFSVYGDCLC